VRFLTLLFNSLYTNIYKYKLLYRHFKFNENHFIHRRIKYTPRENKKSVDVELAYFAVNYVYKWSGPCKQTWLNQPPTKRMLYIATCFSIHHTLIHHSTHQPLNLLIFSTDQISFQFQFQIKLTRNTNKNLINSILIKCSNKHGMTTKLKSIWNINFLK
jgi:hypothetical protein